MKNDKLVPGLILVLIGGAILLANYGYLTFHWWNFARFWPIFLVIGGVNLVLSHNRSAWATILKIAVVVVGVGLLLFGNFGDRYTFWPGRHWWNHVDYSYNSDNNNDDDDNTDDNTKVVKVLSNGTFNEPYKPGTKYAKLNISGGAVAYTMTDTTNQLFSADLSSGDQNRYAFSQGMDDDSVDVIDFRMKDRHGFHFGSDKNKAVIRLNANPIWDFDIATGAASVDFDLSKNKVRNINISGGAASFKLKLGEPLETTEVEIASGAAGIDFLIPKNTACQVESESFLSSVDGLTKADDGTYKTPGYDEAKNKIHVHISGALSGFSVKTY